LDGVRIFANNFAVQGLKIKKSKALLNHIYSLLNRLEAPHLDACPFLAKQDGIHVMDLSFIPEKYRLDVHRAEKILNRALTHWLDALRRYPGGGMAGIRQSET
jgi:ATP-dependent Lon protease